MEQTLIDAGVKNLKEYGYPCVNKENIVTDLIYGAFFKSMLISTMNGTKHSDVIQRACASLIEKIDKASQEQS